MKVASERYKKLEAQGKPKPVKYFFTAKNKLTATEAQETRDFLRSFGKHVIISESKDPEQVPGGLDGVSWEWFVYRKDPEFEESRDQWRDRHGKPTDVQTSGIRVNGDIVDRTVLWKEDGYGYLTLSQIREAHFALATTLCHELSHVRELWDSFQH